MISIIIPTYEMHSNGVEFLHQLLASIDEQIYVPHEVIITDDSENDAIEVYCKGVANIKYFRNLGKKGACPNFNHGLGKAEGDIIKPMFQDDQFESRDCLKKIAEMKTEWCCLTSAHIGGRGDHVPYAETDIYELARGRNTYGSPSAVAWKRILKAEKTQRGNYYGEITFDENLKWLFDCDFYARMVQDYGPPEFIDAKVLIREWDGMATRTIADGGVRVAELEYIESKYINLKPLKP